MTKDDIRALLKQARDQGPFRISPAEAFVPFLPGTGLEISYEPNAIGETDVTQAVAVLARLPMALRGDLSKALLAACQDAFALCADDYGGPQGQLDAESSSPRGVFRSPRVPTVPDDIWPLVSFFGIRVGRDLSSQKPMIAVRGYAAWDAEHGVALIFDDVGRFQRVGTLND